MLAGKTLQDLYLKDDDELKTKITLQREFRSICDIQYHIISHDHSHELHQIQKFLESHPDFNPEYIDAMGLSPVHALASTGKLSLLEYLISKFPNIKLDEPSNQNWTPLAYACFHGHSAMIQCLISKGANIKPALPANLTLLHLAAYRMFPDDDRDRMPILALLREYEFDLNAKDAYGRTYEDVLNFEPLKDPLILDLQNLNYLHLTAITPHFSNPESVEIHITNQNCIQQQDIYHRTPIMHAAIMIAEDFFFRLLPLSDLSIQDIGGKTVLHHAVAFPGNENIVKALLQQDMNVFQEDKLGQNALDIAFIHQSDDILKILQTAALRKILSDKKGVTVYEGLFENGSEKRSPMLTAFAQEKETKKTISDPINQSEVPNLQIKKLKRTPHS